MQPIVYTAITANKDNLRENLAKGNETLYDIWSDRVLSRAEELVEEIGAEKAKIKYPFIPIFQEMRSSGRVSVF